MMDKISRRSLFGIPMMGFFKSSEEPKIDIKLPEIEILARFVKEKRWDVISRAFEILELKCPNIEKVTISASMGPMKPYEPKTPVLLEIRSIYKRKGLGTGDFYEIRGEGWRLACTDKHSFVVDREEQFKKCQSKLKRVSPQDDYITQSWMDNLIAATLVRNLRPGLKIWVDVSAFLADGSLYLENGKIPV